MRIRLSLWAYQKKSLDLFLAYIAAVIFSETVTTTTEAIDVTSLNLLDSD